MHGFIATDCDLHVSELRQKYFRCVQSMHTGVSCTLRTYTVRTYHTRYKYEYRCWYLSVDKCLLITEQLLSVLIIVSTGTAVVSKPFSSSAERLDQTPQNNMCTLVNTTVSTFARDRKLVLEVSTTGPPLATHACRTAPHAHAHAVNQIQNMCFTLTSRKPPVLHIHETIYVCLTRYTSATPPQTTSNVFSSCAQRYLKGVSVALRVHERSATAATQTPHTAHNTSILIFAA